MRASIERVLAALERAGVEYIVVGGVAVVLHGHLRVTSDLDLVVGLSGDNARRAIDALTGLGLRPRLPVSADDFADPEKRQDWIENKGLTVFSLWDPRDSAFVVDLFASEPFEFGSAYRRAQRVGLAGTVAVVASIQDLIAMKRTAGRAIDLDDVLHLEKLLEERDDEGQG